MTLLPRISAITSRAIFPRAALAFVLVAAAVWAVINREHVDLPAVQTWISGFGVWAAAGFVTAYALAAVLFVPGSIFGLAGGALFGPLWGTVWNLAGASIGATLAFLAARYLASDWVARKTGGRLKKLIDGVEAEGWRFVAFVRLVPLFPFNLVNYALGLTRIPLAHYVLASIVCMLPGTLAYTYLGYAGREAAAGGEDLLQKGLIALALLAAVVFLPRLVARLRRPAVDRIEADSMRTRLDHGEYPTILDVRGADEYRGELGHIPGSMNVPMADLPEALPRLASSGEKRAVIVCRTDKRSAKAAEILASAGWHEIEILEGGMEQWNRLGFPVDR
ncbi:MAG: VTT domain-containing protein [Betaproteobacteria bacterium]|nr:VTT domain-containing protein [Betaproteobacteria bacterium]